MNIDREKSLKVRVFPTVGAPFYEAWYFTFVGPEKRTSCFQKMSHVWDLDRTILKDMAIKPQDRRFMIKIILSYLVLANIPRLVNTPLQHLSRCLWIQKHIWWQTSEIPQKRHIFESSQSCRRKINWFWHQNWSLESNQPNFKTTHYAIRSRVP